jgi:hypothetical protein
MMRTCMLALAMTSLAGAAWAAGDSARCAAYPTEADRTECVRTEALNEAAQQPTSWRTIQPAAPAPVQTETRTTTTYETATGKQVRSIQERTTDLPAATVEQRTVSETRTR